MISPVVLLALVAMPPPQGAAPPPAAAPAQGAATQGEAPSKPSYGEIDTINKYDEPGDIEAHVAPIGAFAAYFDTKQRVRERSGFSYVVEYAPILQGGGGDFHVDQEANLIGLWNLVDTPGAGRGNIVAWFQHAYTLGGVTTSELMESLEVISPPNGGDTAPLRSANRLQHLVWEQLMADESVRIMFGKITTRVTIDQNRYAVSDREDYFTPMIVNNPVVPFTARAGVGAFAQYDAGVWYASGLIRDADASSDYIDLESLGTGNWEYALEAAFTPDFAGLGTGNYRATAYYTDAIGAGDAFQSAGWSLSLSFDQDVGARLGTFFRYAHTDEPLRAFQQRIALGAQVLEPFGYEDDRIGVGLWWGQPTDSALRDEYGLEVFWRLQILQAVELTPDLQIMIHPALNRSRTARLVGGLRLRIIL